MGSLYRSEQMRFCQIIVEKDAAFSCVAELGKRPYVQFKDLNPEVIPFQRTFVRDIRRFAELERKLRYLEEHIKRENIPLQTIIDKNFDAVSHYDMNQLETTLNDLERDVKNMTESEDRLKKNFLDLKEWEAVLEKTDWFFQGGIDDEAIQEIEQANEGGDISGGGMQLRTDKEKMKFSVGVIRRDRINAFERIIWRACHRTAFLRYSDIEEPLEDPDSGDKVEKTVFIVFHNSDRLQNIINRVCEGFKARLYPTCPKTSKERNNAAIQVRSQILDLRTVMTQTHEHTLKVLNATAANIHAWKKQVRIHKSVYNSLNYFTFDGIGKFFVAECWIPLNDLDNVRQGLERGIEKSGGTVKPILNILTTEETPPTYNKTNKFTEVFQGIVDSYGIATYLELNPAPYTIITFPFLFSLMFGDLGHGLLMFLAGLYLVLREKNLAARQINDEIFNTFFGGRYIILLMGLFSMHAGLVYNDVFAKSFNIFQSSWKNPYDPDMLLNFDNISLPGKEIMLIMPAYPAFDHDKGPYAFGMDPIWNIGENKLNFLNSLKMKLSVITGISQMTFGVILSLQNYRYFKSSIEIYTVFIPQILFMGCIFIYLCLQIILKWIFFWVRPTWIFGQWYPGSYCAPSLLIGLINMFMFKTREAGFVVDNGFNGTAINQCYLNQWYPGQSLIESLLVIIAVLCIPVMLFGKPGYIIWQQRKARRAVGDNISVRINMHTEETDITVTNGNGVKPEATSVSHAHAEHHDEAFGDIMVHQAIHTIEYVLGCVSHTASYLRLWALSLAHAQLSEVLWHMVLVQPLVLDGILGAIALSIIFFVFAILTFSILVLMEGLSAFLHTLRLHWVEFQSKFFLGLGHAFQPFSFKQILEEARIADMST